jgi:hypothetical protein
MNQGLAGGIVYDTHSAGAFKELYIGLPHSQNKQNNILQMLSFRYDIQVLPKC